MNKRGGSRFDFRIRAGQIAKSKRSSEMAIGTLVVIILAIIVLVVLIMGFTMGWKTLWAKINPFIGGGGSGGGNNVDSVKVACQVLCDSASVSPSSKIDYCKEKKAVIFTDGTKTSDSCNNLKTKLGMSCSVSC